MEPGDIFAGRYRILDRLGSGGFATVYLAEHTQIGQRVAIKSMPQGENDARFLREAKILVQLESPHTVRVLDYGEDERGDPYMISEFIDGDTLEAVGVRAPLPPEEVVEIMLQALDSLAEAHAKGIIHRDVKPANIMVQNDGRVKVLDFGIARADTQNTEALTASGVVLGTPRFLAPECFLGGHNVTYATDTYALGLIAFGLLTGRDANAGKNSQEIIARHLTPEPWEWPTSAAVPAPLVKWVTAMIEKDPARRIPDAAAARATLLDVARTLEPTSAPTGPRELDLELGAGPLPDVAIPPASPMVERPPRSSPRRATSARPRGGTLVVAALVATGTAALGWYALERLMRPPTAPVRVTSSPSVPDPPEIATAYAEGREALDHGQWLEALEKFHTVMQHPTSSSARHIARQDLVGRAVGKILEQAIDARERARTPQAFDAAAAGPQRVLELFPDYEAAAQTVASIEQAKQTYKPDSARRKIRIEGIRSQ